MLSITSRVEETAASAMSLRDQADALVQAVALFRGTRPAAADRKRQADAITRII